MLPLPPSQERKQLSFMLPTCRTAFFLGGGVLLSKQNLNWLSEFVKSAEPMGRTLDFFIDLQRLCRVVKASQ